MKPAATGFVKIVKIPAGEAPEWVRLAWVGLTLPCFPAMGYPDSPEVGVLSGEHTNKHDCGNDFCDARNGRLGVSVPQAQALAILEEHDPLAAAWWRDNGYSKTDEHEDCFGFAKDEVLAVSGVTHCRIVEVTDEMMGDPYR